MEELSQDCGIEAGQARSLPLGVRTPTGSSPLSTMTHRVPPFPGSILEQIARVLGDTETGLTGREIGWALQKARIADIDQQNTKWVRIYNAFVQRQNADQSADRILSFIRHALDPVQ